jgi:glucose-1-phosphate thymidylyltransferase
MKGIVLAGGKATRLRPCTVSISKHLLPIYDKPMIYYPLSALMLAGIREILVIVNPNDLPQYQLLLGDGSKFGVDISFETQLNPNGIAEAFLIGEKFLDDEKVCLVLGDNIFFGDELTVKLCNAANSTKGCHIFVTPVSDPERYGIATLGPGDELISVVEKPTNPSSNLAITGIYFFDKNVVNISKMLAPSGRGELEITGVIDEYLKRSDVSVSNMGRGFTWLDAGTSDSLLEAGEFIQTTQKRHGLLVCSPEEIAHNNGWLTRQQLSDTIGVPVSDYEKKLMELLG